MKRILTIILAAFMAVSALAQTDRDPIYSSADGKVTFNLLSYIGYGYNIVQTDAFTPSSSGETFLNVFQVGLFPTEHLGIKLGADVAYNYFGTKENMFFLDNNQKIWCTTIPSFDGTLEKFRSSIGSGSVNFPLLVKGIFGDFQLGVGAEGRLNFAGATMYSYKMGNSYYSVEERKAKLNLFNYDILAALTYKDMSLYFKYYPKSSHFLPDGSVDFNWMTLGIVIGM